MYPDNEYAVTILAFNSYMCCECVHLMYAHQAHAGDASMAKPLNELAMHSPVFRDAFDCPYTLLAILQSSRPVLI